MVIRSFAKQHSTLSKLVSHNFIRIAKRRTSWTLPPADIRNIEFKDRQGNPDLRPSVYEIIAPDNEVTRACTEHYAAIPLKVESRVLSIFTGEQRSVVPSDGNSKFSFIQTRHREVDLADESALMSFIDSLSQQLKNSATKEVAPQDMIAYAKHRVELRDPEWISVISDPRSHDRKWLKILHREFEKDSP
jgi:hypothetical protein